MADDFQLFDSHFHIIDPAFPVVQNEDYALEPFTRDDYLARMSNHDLVGGAVISGSFQGFDQGYRVSALKVSGPSFVGVTQLHASGVRALRFNQYRGGSETLEHRATMARRVHERVG